ncbi:alpha-ketoglutarate-dependent dioxygenase AlkB [Vibrio sp. SCSIO 43140]|uniref:alpha-ketoglutarate-dependent dioxygenase AlkB family protein n=1 Tax=Vibrio sp. SCSIO 43140 TaxID=2819100 RepID=UPI002075B472|nr:alpha-ketoglutarate-dependent dioxygenase AlkB [Vibrio sp. SCSIO 43140]USD62797.1 alpha-ketoglutarate-dependent dioxygenase AlkB [Vibrio sp. SCSIO 43140]
MKLLENQWNEVPDGRLLWLPNYFTSDQASDYYQQLQERLAWRQDSIVMFGKKVAIPRLQAWYGDASYTYSNLKLEPLPWNPLLDSLKAHCEKVAGSQFNSVLANLYRDGQDSNGWHSDDEKELGTNPVIASMSFGAERRFLLRHKMTGEKMEFNLTSGSLLIMAGETQHHWQHTIPKTKRFVEPRINLTFRKVLVP